MVVRAIVRAFMLGGLSTRHATPNFVVYLRIQSSTSLGLAYPGLQVEIPSPAKIARTDREIDQLRM
jgi:hypothetical protein